MCLNGQVYGSIIFFRINGQRFYNGLTGSKRAASFFNYFWVQLSEAPTECLDVKFSRLLILF